MTIAIEAVNLVKVFGGFRAVDGVNLKVEEGTIFGLLGPNGAGKSTTIRLILGLLKPTSGYVKVFGISVEKNRKEVLKITGYMPQQFSLYEDLTVEENMRLYASMYGIKSKEANERIQQLMDEFNLREIRNRLAGKLSGGMKQRLALAVALIHNPKLLVVDEPTAGVDPPLRRYFWEKFRELKRRGVTILVTTHYMDEAENCDRIALMSRGRVAAEGTPLQIKRLAFGGDLVELVVEGDPRPKLINLDAQILEFEKDGSYSRLRLLVSDASEKLVLLTKNFEKEGIKVVRAYPVYVSLEDAFIRLTSR
ncbi:MAG: ABC transporter ATP-binding protein [Thermofilum sp.]|jgi:ABC-2 type transport system ATP-binding protein|uniref:ABC transporter ATP-binding protein n=1 Tax=Thermofilum sp. TaxID=1961369 RepID=UPI002585DD3B|nr:ABC transporter ATP-binding protein [Thermofilum sp.]MCI4409333.1 ABC transporter ATP-binding protein [Thermofilum sp.]